MPLSAQQVAEIKAHERAEGRQRRVTLTIFHHDGMRVVPLAEGRRVVIGRSEPAEVTIRDGSLSRQHAAVELIDGRVWVEDLESTNGTWVGGVRVDRIQVALGSELMLGGVAATVDQLGAADQGRHGLLRHDRFLDELAAEVARARQYQPRPVSLLMVRGPRQAGTSLGRWLKLVQRSLRPFDRAALYSADTVELLLPELALDQAQALAASLRSDEVALSLGLGVFPDHAASAEELIEVTRGALARARGDGLVVTPEALATGARAAAAADVSGPIVRSPGMERVFRTARRVASSAIPVLIVGETGTGKEVVARAIHESGKRADKAMICVNCGALPPQLVEATLFGHEKGAFTGASQQARGVFEAADGGTVFLDEIGELPAGAQAALLRVLETKRFTRVGSTREVEVDARVVAATHRDLEQMSAAGGFRSDLLYRLNAMQIEIPPLRERTDEIEPLVQLFIAKANETNGCAVADVAADALALLREHGWPGNVRELRNAIERAVVIAEGSTITIDDLPRTLSRLAGQRPRPEPPARPAAHAVAGDGESWPDEIDLRAELERFESSLIRTFLDRAGGDRKEAARRMGLPYRTLSHKMMVMGLSNEPGPAPPDAGGAPTGGAPQDP
jgi:DNA-binding NtrC family response regulator